jgi:hypothetical protein
MNKHMLVLGLALLLTTGFLVQAKPDRTERSTRSDKALLKPTRPPGRSLYLDYDPAFVLSIGKSHHQFDLKPEQIRQLHSLVLKFQEALPKERAVAQQARDELEKEMNAEKPDEAVVQRIADRASVAEAVLLRGRLQFWLELRQKFGREVFEKIQQTIYRHLNRIEEPVAKFGNDEIFPAKKPELPAKD